MVASGGHGVKDKVGIAELLHLDQAYLFKKWRVSDIRILNGRGGKKGEKA